MAYIWRLNEGVFCKIADLLRKFAGRFAISYEAANIIVYFFIIPFSWLILLDIALSFFFFTPLFLLTVFILKFFIKHFETFSGNLCDLAINILNSFSFMGMDYLVASIVFCVIFPIIIYTFLILLILL